MTTAQQLSNATLWWLSFGIAALLGALPAAAYLRRLDREDRDAQQPAWTPDDGAAALAYSEECIGAAARTIADTTANALAGLTYYEQWRAQDEADRLLSGDPIDYMHRIDY